MTVAGTPHYSAHVTCSRGTSSSRDRPPVGCLVVRSDDLRWELLEWDGGWLLLEFSTLPSFSFR